MMEKIKVILSRYPDIETALKTVFENEGYGDTYYRILAYKRGSLLQGTPEWNEYLIEKQKEKESHQKLIININRFKSMNESIIISKAKNGYVITFGKFQDSLIICQTQEDVLNELGKFFTEFKNTVKD